MEYSVVAAEVQGYPWLGTGFAASWNPQNYLRREQLVGFPVVSGHNDFLDILLNAGVVGFIILLTFYVCTLAMVVARVRRHDPLGWMALLILTFYLPQNLTSSIFAEFYEISLIALFQEAESSIEGADRGQEATRRLVALTGGSCSEISGRFRMLREGWPRVILMSDRKE